MSIFERVRGFFSRRQPKQLVGWFLVAFDEDVVRIKAEPPGREAWSQEFKWASVIRVCFKAEDLYVSDGVYVFTIERPESYVIPIEASGGAEFWSEILRRELFDAELAIKAAQSSGGLFCWPPDGLSI